MHTYSIVYSSNTGNTALLAKRLKAVLPEADCRYYGAPDVRATDAELLLIGFRTDKGDCDETVSAFLEKLRGKRVFLFGTAGFGGSNTYFEQILVRVRAHLDVSNTVVGTFMCQGKMPETVRQRYEAMAISAPEKARPLIENYERALSHPDADDLERLAGIAVNLHAAKMQIK